jgi:hypothetical protein
MSTLIFIVNWKKNAAEGTEMLKVAFGEQRMGEI